MEQKNVGIGLVLLAIILLLFTQTPIVIGLSTISSFFNQGFLDLNDTPNSYTGQAGKSIIVNPSENGLIFSSISGGSGGNGRTYTSGTPATIQVNNDLNTISQNFEGNFYSRLTSFIPWQDVNVSDDLRINTIKDANFNNIRFNGVLSGGDFNYSLNDANNSQTASPGSALSSVGATVTSIAIPPSLGSCDNNALCRIVTNYDANFNANVDINGLLNIKNSDKNIYLSALINSIFFSGVSPANIITNSKDLQLQTNSSDGNIILTNFTALKPLLNNITRLGDQSNIFSTLFINDVNVRNDLNVHANQYSDGNFNLTTDGISFIGTLSKSLGGVYSKFFNCTAAVNSNGGCLTVNAGNWVWQLNGISNTGGDFNNSNRSFGLKQSNTYNFAWGLTGSSDKISFQRPINNASPVWQGTGPAFDTLNAGSSIMYSFGSSVYPRYFDGNVWRYYGSNNPGDQNVGNDLNVGSNVKVFKDINVVQDLNVGGKISISSGYTNRCAGVSALSSGVVTVSTTCFRDLNSMVFLTKLAKGIGWPVTPVMIDSPTYGTSFRIKDSNATGDQNVAWMIVQLFK